MANQVRHIVVPAAGELSGVVADLLREAPEKVSEWLRLGAIYRDKKRVFNDGPVKKGDYLRVHTRPRRYDPPADLGERILHLDERLVILDKPCGVPCHATVDNGVENLLHWMSEHLRRPLWITHRLDVPTQGCLVMALSTEAAARFNRILQEDALKKSYDAWVEGRVERTGLVRHWMVDGQWAPREVREVPFEKALECVLEIERADYDPSWDCSRVSIRLHTGRTHQIRAQMAALGHPLLGDGMYGSRHPLKRDERIALRARELSYPDPWARGALRVFQARDELAEPTRFIRPRRSDAREP